MFKTRYRIKVKYNINNAPIYVPQFRFIWWANVGPICETEQRAREYIANIKKINKTKIYI